MRRGASTTVHDEQCRSRGNPHAQSDADWAELGWAGLHHRLHPDRVRGTMSPTWAQTTKSTAGLSRVAVGII